MAKIASGERAIAVLAQEADREHEKGKRRIGLERDGHEGDQQQRSCARRAEQRKDGVERQKPHSGDMRVEPTGYQRRLRRERDERRKEQRESEVGGAEYGESGGGGKERPACEVELEVEPGGRGDAAEVPEIVDPTPFGERLVVITLGHQQKRRVVVVMHERVGDLDDPDGGQHHGVGGKENEGEARPEGGGKRPSQRFAAALSRGNVCRRCRFRDGQRIRPAVSCRCMSAIVARSWRQRPRPGRVIAVVPDRQQWTAIPTAVAELVSRPAAAVSRSCPDDNDREGFPTVSKWCRQILSRRNIITWAERAT